MPDRGSVLSFEIQEVRMRGARIHLAQECAGSSVAEWLRYEFHQLCSEFRGRPAVARVL